MYTKEDELALKENKGNGRGSDGMEKDVKGREKEAAKLNSRAFDDMKKKVAHKKAKGKKHA